MKKYYVYFHYTKDTNELFYIGKGSKNRFKSYSKRNSYWKNVVNKHRFISKIIESNLEEEVAFMIEILAIEFFNPKCNLTEGGEGNTGIPHPNSAKAIRKMWQNMSKEEKSKEQKRRSSFRKLKGIICLTNNKYYNTAKEAAKDLNIKYEQHVTRVANGNRKSHRGYKFKYAT